MDALADRRLDDIDTINESLANAVPFTRRNELMEDVHDTVILTDVKSARTILKDKLVNARYLALDLEGDLDARGCMSLISTEYNGSIYLFDIWQCPAILQIEELRTILESFSIIKIVHSCRNDAEAIFGQSSIHLRNVFDTQCAHAVLQSPTSNLQVGLNMILQLYAGASNALKDVVRHRPGLWETRPLSRRLCAYAAADVRHLRAAEGAITDLLQKRNLLSIAMERSQRNVDTAMALAHKKKDSIAASVAPDATFSAGSNRLRPPAPSAPPAVAAGSAAIDAWKARIFDHLAAAGETLLSALGVMFPRPGGIKKMSKGLAVDPRFTVKNDLVCLTQPPRNTQPMQAGGGGGFTVENASPRLSQSLPGNTDPAHAAAAAAAAGCDGCGGSGGGGARARPHFRDVSPL